MSEFSVLQRPPDAPAFGPDALVWRTCVRQVAFVDGDRAIPEGVLAWHDEAAYAHLLEVICGLHSPIVGETEVLHQFKVFSDGLSPSHLAWREVCARLLADARTVRAHHLNGLGSRSYGSAVRRHVRESRRVALFGTGVLARELVPYLADDRRTIDLWGRRLETSLTAPGLTYRRLGSPLDSVAEPAAIVIAAPMSGADIATHTRRYGNPSVLVDLRAQGRVDPPPPIAPVVTLDDVFAEFTRAADATDRRVTAARAEIRACARAFATRAKFNPSGWHDLCA